MGQIRPGNLGRTHDLKPAKGQWLNPNGGELFEERMIPVRVACTEKQIKKIMEFTKKHYSQIVVMAYRISDRVLVF